MDVLAESLKQFWKVLNTHEVRYIMIGGFATRFHGYNRATDDLDLWLDDTLENRRKLRKAFINLDYGDMDALETMQFIAGWSNFYISNGIYLDIVTSMKGLEDLSFQECLDLASVADIDGIAVPFLHLNHLIQNKKITDRPKDRIDVIELEKIKKIREEQFK